jgi:hypothetical protein
MFGERVPVLSTFYVEPPQQAPNPSDLVNVMTKDDYINVLKKKRKEFVHSHFSNDLEDLFSDLQLDANAMKSCHKQCEFIVPEPYDQNKIEAMLLEYFKDLGFKPMTEDKKIVDENGKKINKIMFTIT